MRIIIHDSNRSLSGLKNFCACRGSWTILRCGLAHLHKSQIGLEAVATKTILPKKMIAEARRELFETREGILKLMDEFRGRSQN